MLLHLPLIFSSKVVDSGSECPVLPSAQFFPTSVSSLASGSPVSISMPCVAHFTPNIQQQVVDSGAWCPVLPSAFDLISYLGFNAVRPVSTIPPSRLRLSLPHPSLLRLTSSRHLFFNPSASDSGLCTALLSSTGIRPG